MKYTFVIFVLYLVSASAGPSNKTIDVEGKVENILKEMIQTSKDAVDNLKVQVEEVYLDRVKQVDAAVSEIDDLREIDDKCVAAEEKNVATTVNDMHKSMAICGAKAVETSADIVKEISTPTKQIILDGYDVLRLYQKCKNYRNPILKNSCYTRLTVKGTLYVKNTRKSTNDIKKTVNGRVPELRTESDDCADRAASVAMNQLKEIRESIEACIKGA